MVRVSKRAALRRRALAPSSGVDMRHFDRLRAGQRGQEMRQALGQHRFARAGRPAHEQVMAAGRGHHQSSLGGKLPFTSCRDRPALVPPLGVGRANGRGPNAAARASCTASANVETGKSGASSSPASSRALAPPG